MNSRKTHNVPPLVNCHHNIVYKTAGKLEFGTIFYRINLRREHNFGKSFLMIISGSLLTPFEVSNLFCGWVDCVIIVSLVKTGSSLKSNYHNKLSL